MSIKVIIMDVDGTLTTNKKLITEKTKTALLTAQERGAKLILASGKPTSGLMGFVRELEMDKHNGLVVSFNGSKVIDSDILPAAEQRGFPNSIPSLILRHKLSAPMLFNKSNVGLATYFAPSVRVFL